jgi:hypothetical protein
MCGEVSALPSYVITLSGYSDRHLVVHSLNASHLIVRETDSVMRLMEMPIGSDPDMKADRTWRMHH